MSAVCGTISIPTPRRPLPALFTTGQKIKGSNSRTKQDQITLLLQTDARARGKVAGPADPADRRAACRSGPLAHTAVSNRITHVSHGDGQHEDHPTQSSRRQIQRHRRDGARPDHTGPLTPAGPRRGLAAAGCRMVLVYRHAPLPAHPTRRIRPPPWLFNREFINQRIMLKPGQYTVFYAKVALCNEPAVVAGR